MKKKLSLILLITIISFFSVSSEVLGASGDIKVAASNTLSYSLGGVKTSVKTSSYGIVYCLDHRNDVPNPYIYSISKRQDISSKYPGIAYIIQNGYHDTAIKTSDAANKLSTEKKRSYYITQVAINWYMDRVDGYKDSDSGQLGWAKTCELGGCSASNKKLYNEIKNLVEKAWEYHNNYKKGLTNNSKISLTADIKMSENEYAYISNQIGVVGGEEDYKVNLINAPQGSKILSASGKNEKYLFKSNEQFLIYVPKNSVAQGNNSFQVKVEKTSKIVKVYAYYPNSYSPLNKSKLQRVAPIVYENSVLSIQKPVSINNVIPQCVYTNSEHFKLSYKPSDNITRNGVTIPYCCTQFPDKPNLVEDHPECGYCPETTTITLVDKDKDTGDEINSHSNNVGINDASDRCSVVNNGNEPNSKWGRTSGYEIKDQLTGGIENNTCLPITSDSSDGNSSTLIKKKLNGRICYVTCVENDNFNIPSNPLVTTTASHFVWPTSPATNKMFPNIYPLTATGNITCRIIVNTLALNSVSDKEGALKKCTQNLSTALSDIDSFNPEISLYQNGDYSNEYKLQSIDEANPNKVCNYGTANNINTQIDCDKISSNLTNIVNNQSNIDNKVKAIREHRFSITKTMSFELDSELNNYVVKSSNKSTSIKPNPNFEPYIVVGYGNIPINVYSTVKSFSYNETASVDGNLDLRFRKISNHFKDTEVSCLVDYTAHAAGPGDNTTNYYCRPGTKRAGWNISSCVNNGVINNNCVIELCSSDEGHACSWFTDNPGLEIDNNDWDNIYNYYKDVAHKTNDIAKNLTQNYFDNSSLCSRGTDGDDPECPEDSQKPHLNISSCVKSFFMDINSDGYSDDRDVSLFQQIVQGTKIPTASEKKAADINNDGRVDNLDYKKYIEYNTRNYGNINSIDAAKTICYKVEKCYKKVDKLYIVRSIDLNNPFPSISGVTGDDTDVLGRLPGKNWRTGDNLNKSTQTIVNTYITNNRDVETNEVYKKAPLYTFELNASTIKKIREYNHSIDDRTGKRMDYETYHLDCTNSSTSTHDRECISEFVHNTSYGYVDNSASSACNSIENGKFYDCTKRD